MKFANAASNVSAYVGIIMKIDIGQRSEWAGPKPAHPSPSQPSPWAEN